MNIEELAKKMRVSPSTISRALNPATERMISDVVRKRIQNYAAKVGYIPNRTAQELVKGRSHAIGVILSTSFNSLFFSDHLAKVQSGIYSVLEGDPHYSCKLVVLPRGKPLSEADQHIIGIGIDGLLISTLCDFTAYKLRDLANAVQRRWNRPIVALNLDARSAGRISTVSFSNFDAAYKAVTHLIQNGHSRIGLVYADNNSADAMERVEGCKKALADHKLSPASNLMVRGDFSAPSGYQATLELFKRKEAADVTALFCTNDEMAIGAIRALKALRKRCPQDVAVMGFDGLAMGEFIDPRLSTVTQPSYEIAKAGARLLLDLIEGKQKGPAHLTIPSDLIVRDSA